MLKWSIDLSKNIPHNNPLITNDFLYVSTLHQEDMLHNNSSQSHEFEEPLIPITACLPFEHFNLVVAFFHEP